MRAVRSCGKLSDRHIGSRAPCSSHTRNTISGLSGSSTPGQVAEVLESSLSASSEHPLHCSLEEAVASTATNSAYGINSTISMDAWHSSREVATRTTSACIDAVAKSGLKVEYALVGRSQETSMDLDTLVELQQNEIALLHTTCSSQTSRSASSPLSSCEVHTGCAVCPSGLLLATCSVQNDPPFYPTRMQL